MKFYSFCKGVNLIERARQLQAWAYWKEIEVNREKHKFNQEWLESQMDFIYSIRTLALSVVQINEFLPVLNKKIRDDNFCDEGTGSEQWRSEELSNLIMKMATWLSRYAGEEKKDD